MMPAQLTSKVGAAPNWLSTCETRDCTAAAMVHAQSAAMRTACARTGVRDVHCIAGRVGSDLIYSAAAWLLVNTCHGCTMRGQLESSRPTDALRRACHDRELYTLLPFDKFRMLHSIYAKAYRVDSLAISPRLKKTWRS